MLRKRLQAKIVLWIALILAVFLGTSYYVTTNRTLKSLNEEFEEATRSKAILLMDAIYNNIAYTTESGHMRQLLQMAELTNSYTELQAAGDLLAGRHRSASRSTPRTSARRSPRCTTTST